MMGALPKALARRGHRVMVIAPRYKSYDVRLLSAGCGLSVVWGVVSAALRHGVWCLMASGRLSLHHGVHAVAPAVKSSWGT